MTPRAPTPSSIRGVDADTANPELEFLSAIIETQNDIATVEMDPATAMQIIVERTRKLVAADGAAIVMLEGDEMVFRSACGTHADHVGMRFPVQHSLCEISATTSKVLVCADTEIDPRANTTISRRLNVRSIVLVPLAHNGKVLGVLNVTSIHPNRFNHCSVSGLRLMAGVLAAALANASEFESKRLLLAQRAHAIAALSETNNRLRESEERFRNAFDHAAIGMALVGLDGRWLQVNRSVCRIVGYTEQELLVTDFQSITYPPDLNADLTRVRQLISGEILDYQMVKRYIHRQGHLVWVLLSVSALRSATGEPLYLISQLQDITRRREAEEALRASEEEYRATFELAGVGKAQTDLKTGRLVRVNPKFCEFTGYTSDELLTMSFTALTHHADLDVGAHAEQRFMRGEVTDYTVEKRYIRKDGRVVWGNLNAALIRNAEGVPVRIVSTIQDVTQRKRADWLEEDRRRVLEMVAKDIPLPDVLAQLCGAIERQIEGAAAAFMAVEDGRINLSGQNLPFEWRDAINSQCLPIAAALAADAWCSGGNACGISYIAGETVWKDLRPLAATLGLETCWSVGVSSSDGSPLGLLTIFVREKRGPSSVEFQTLDMAGKLAAICVEHHNTTRQLAHLVRHDRLTGLPNRIYFEDRLQQAISLSRRTGKSMAVLALDVDHFKNVNDTLGHDAGDSLLQQFAQRIRLQLRETDTLARMGGDEFVIILPEADADAAAAVATKITASLTDSFSLAGRTLAVSSSIGVALHPRDGVDSPSLQSFADAQMYKVKRNGRNGFAMVSQSIA